MTGTSERELPGEWLTSVQVARLLELSRQRIDQLRRDDRLPALRSPLGWLYNRVEVIEWQISRKEQENVTATEPQPADKPEPSAGATWQPGLNADQLAIDGPLEFRAEDLSGSNLATAVTVAGAWSTRAKAEGQGGELKYPEEFASAFEGAGEPEPKPEPEPEPQTEEAPAE